MTINRKEASAQPLSVVTEEQSHTAATAVLNILVRIASKENPSIDELGVALDAAHLLLVACKPRGLPYRPTEATRSMLRGCLDELQMLSDCKPVDKPEVTRHENRD